MSTASRLSVAARHGRQRAAANQAKHAALGACFALSCSRSPSLPLSLSPPLPSPSLLKPAGPAPGRARFVFGRAASALFIGGDLELRQRAPFQLRTDVRDVYRRPLLPRTGVLAPQQLIVENILAGKRPSLIRMERL